MTTIYFSHQGFWNTTPVWGIRNTDRLRAIERALAANEFEGSIGAMRRAVRANRSA